MKEITLTMDPNGHIQKPRYGGVLGDHNAALLHIVMEEPADSIQFYRLLFAGEKGSKITEQLFYTGGELCYTLPESVTNLGHTVFCQLCGYQIADSEVILLYKSDAVPLTFGTALTDTGDLADTPLTDELAVLLNDLEIFAREFNLELGAVSTLDATENATATLEKEGYRYTLNLAIPKGQKGADGASGTANLSGENGITVENDVISADFDIIQKKLTAGNGVSIVGNTISISGNNGVYDAIANDYGYLGIEDSRTVTQLAGYLLLINPKYANAGTYGSFYTSGEGVYKGIAIWNGSQLTEKLPVGCIIPGRVMALYIDDNGNPIYLNPHMPDSTPYTVTADLQTDVISQLTLSVTDYTLFENGKTIVAMATNDILLNGVAWYGPLSCPVEYFNGTDWVGVEQLQDKIVYAGQPVVLQLNYNPDNYTFRYIRILNVPQDCGTQWHSMSVPGVSSSYEPVVMYYKRCGDTVTIRFEGSGASDITQSVCLGTLPEEYRPAYATDYDGLPILATNAFDPKVYFAVYSDGRVYFNPTTLHGNYPISPDGWRTTSFSYTL